MARIEWDEILKKLHEILSKELFLAQEILGNMNQQEYTLLIGDISIRDGLYIQCNQLVDRLRGAMEQQKGLTRNLFDHLPYNTTKTTLDEILNPLLEIEGEILLLYQNTKRLIEKIHGQDLRNKTLHQMILKEGPINVNNKGLRSKKRGTTLITIDYPEEKEEI